MGRACPFRCGMVQVFFFQFFTYKEGFGFGFGSRLILSTDSSLLLLVLYYLFFTTCICAVFHRNCGVWLCGVSPELRGLVVRCFTVEN